MAEESSAMEPPIDEAELKKMGFDDATAAALVASMKEEEKKGTPAVAQSAEPLPWEEIAARGYARVLCKDTPMDDPRFQRNRAEAMNLLKQFQARDAVEQMLITQMLWTHARVGALTRRAMLQPTPKNLELFNTLADRGCNTFRRTLEALQGCRKPKPRRKTVLTTIRTAHITAQQIVSSRPLVEGVPRLEAVTEAASGK